MYLPLSRPPLGLPYELNRTSPQARGLRVLIPVHAQRPGNLVTELVSGAHGAAGTGVSWLADGAPPVRYIDVAGAATGVVTFATHPAAAFITGVCSFAGWVRPDVVAATGAQTVFGDGNAAASGGALSLIFGVTAGAARTYWNGTYVSTSSAVFTAGTWYHVAIVRTGSTGAWTVQWYVNGEAAGTTTGIATNPSAPTSFALGRFGAYTGGIFFNGGMSDLRFYNRALSAAEVLALWAPQTRWELYGVRVPRGRGASAFFATMMQHHHAMLAGGRS